MVMLMREFHPLSGGYQNQALRLAREMVRRKVPIHVVTQRHPGLARTEVHDGIPIHRVFVLRRGSGSLIALSYLVSSFLWMARNRRRFDLIHANRSSSGLVAGLIGFVLGKKVLYKLTRGDEIDVKGFRTTPWGRFKLFLLRHTVDRFVAITAGIEKDLKGLGIPAAKIARISNGIPLVDPPNSCDPRSIRSEIGFPANASVATFVGRLEHAKGVDWLLEVWRQVAAEEPGARLLIVGEGGERAALEARARDLGISRSVAFVGQQRGVFRLLAGSDVFVLPSRLEGISNSLIEAMSLALPVVAADDRLGGNREVIADRSDGFLVPLGDGDALAKAILGLLRDPALRAEMGRRARRKVEREFSMEAVSARYVALYEELADGTRKGS